MSYYSLPLKRHNEDIQPRYLYLEIAKYRNDYLTTLVDGKRMKQDELKKRKQDIETQNETLKALDSGYINCFNRPIETSDALDRFFPMFLEDMSSRIFYRINPLSSNDNTDRYYRDQKRYKLFEFNVIRKMTTKEDVIDQLHIDGILDEFSAQVIQKFSYSNEGYQQIIIDYFEYIKGQFPNLAISLEEIMLVPNYTHEPRELFCPSNTYDNTRETIRYLLDNNLIVYKKDYEYNDCELITALVNCGMSDVASKLVDVLKSSEEYQYKATKIADISNNSKVDAAFRLHSSDENVRQMLDKLNMKLSGVVLTISNYDDYNTKNEEKRFENINQLKTFLIKEYNVAFEYLANRDASKIEYGNYVFEIN